MTAAATEHHEGYSRTARRRHLRKAHGGRLKQALFLVDLQIRGLRQAIADLGRSPAEESRYAVIEPVLSPVWSRDLLLQARPAAQAATAFAAPPGLAPSLRLAPRYDQAIPKNI